TLREIPPAGSVQIFPTAPPTVTLTAGQSVAGINFGNFTGRVIRGGVRDDLGQGLAGWTVYIDLNRNGQFDPGEPSRLTHNDGNSSFDNLAPGSYNVAEVVPTGWVPTAPGGLSFAPVDSPFSLPVFEAPVSGDFNNDGTDDLLIPDDTGRWFLAL